MNLLDLEMAATTGLASLPHRPYLRMMYGVVRQHRAIYDAFLIPDARPLVADSELLLAAVVASTDPDGRTAFTAAELAAQWAGFDGFFADDIRVAHEGLTDVYATIRLLVEEVAGQAPHGAATARCLVPFTVHPDAWPPSGYLACDMPAEMANSPLVTMIRRVERMVNERAAEIPRVPLHRIRRFIFGDTEAVLWNSGEHG
jgi:hypothetical protein